MRCRRVFAVGRRTARRTSVIVTQRVRSPILGPWTLQAIVLRN